MRVEELLARLNKVHRSSTGWQACCPAHDDRTPSLSISEGNDGRILLFCHTGCSLDAVLDALGLRRPDLLQNGKESHPTQSSSRAAPKHLCKRGKLHHTPEAAAGAAAYGLKRKYKKPFEPVAWWSYHDKKGNEVGRVYRLENPADGPASKEYRPLHRDGDGWRIGDPPGGFPLYRLPGLVLSPGPVFVTEGEKASDALSSLGLTVTTSAHGAKSAKKADWSALAGKDVFLLPDNDPPNPDGTSPGMAYVDEVARQLHKLRPPANVRLLVLPDLPSKGDAFEFVQMRRQAGRMDEEIRIEVKELAATAVNYELTKDEDLTDTGLPTVFLPGGARNVRITESASNLGRLLAAKETVFARGGSVVSLQHESDSDVRLVPVTPAALTSILEEVGELYTTVKGKGSGNIIEVPRNCSKDNADKILSSPAFLLELPSLRLLTRCAVLVEHDGELATVNGYHRPTGIYAAGGKVEDMSPEEAVSLLEDSLAGFKFATGGDRSRALAAIISPALVQGGLLKGRAPVDLSEADQSQAGKGYRARLVASIYNDTPRTITQSKGGVRSLEEGFSMALIRGAAFVSLDNVRGKLDSPGIESGLTEDFFQARGAYHPLTEIDMRRIVVMMTSNEAELTPDLANRTSPVRLRKQLQGYPFKKYPNGADILDHIQNNQALYLGAVFAVVRAWYEAGCPRTNETRHDFRPWAQALDWIVQNIFCAVPLCGGLSEAKARMSTPGLSWLRSVTQAVIGSGRLGEWLRTNQLVSVLEREGTEVPGLGENGDLNDDDAASNVLRATGRRLSNCFAAATRVDVDGVETAVLTIDEMTIERRLERSGELRKDIKTYRFLIQSHMGAEDADDSSELSLTRQSTTVSTDSCDHGAPMDAPIEDPMESPAAPIAPIGSEHFSEYGRSTVESDSPGNDPEESMVAMGARAQVPASDQSEFYLSESESTPDRHDESREVFEL